MAGKCCCKAEINQAKQEILNALNGQGGIKQGNAGGGNINIPIDLIARSVANLLNQNKSSFETDVLIQLRAINQALLALKSRLDDDALLKQIARNTNDIITQAGENQRANYALLEQTATKGNARDLLTAVTDSRRDLTGQLRSLAIGIATRFVTIATAIAGIGVAIAATSKAILAAEAVSTTRILSAISALKFGQGNQPDLTAIAELLSELTANRLSLEPLTLQVPICEIKPDGKLGLGSRPVASFAIRDSTGNSTAGTALTLSDMLASLMTVGQLNCDEGALLGSEVILDEEENESPNKVYFAYPALLEAEYFILLTTVVNPTPSRTYKLAGEDSEYGAGNWSLADRGESALQSFTHIYCRVQRLDVPQTGFRMGVRVSPKANVAVKVIAFGKLYS